jgi:hypothetical protein
MQQHDGFNAKGKVTDIVAANKSVKHLAEHAVLVQGYYHTLTNLDGHLTH